MPSSKSRHPAYTQYHITKNNQQRSSSNSENSTDPVDGDQETIDKPILAINYKNKYLGGAAWRPRDNTLTILGDAYCANVDDLINLGTYIYIS